MHLRRQQVWVTDFKPVAVSHQVTSDPTHTYGPLPLYTGKTLRLAKQELFLKTPSQQEPLHFLRPSAFPPPLVLRHPQQLEEVLSDVSQQSL